MTRKLTAEQIQANREAWAKALESGEYKQLRNSFCERGRREYCCLAVAAIVVSGGTQDDGYPRCGLWTALEGVGVRDNYQEKDALVRANDDEGKTFPEIAAMVRALPPVTEAHDAPH